MQNRLQIRAQDPRKPSGEELNQRYIRKIIIDKNDLKFVKKTFKKINIVYKNRTITRRNLECPR